MPTADPPITRARRRSLESLARRLADEAMVLATEAADLDAASLSSGSPDRVRPAILRVVRAYADLARELKPDG